MIHLHLTKITKLFDLENLELYGNWLYGNPYWCPFCVSMKCLKENKPLPDRQEGWARYNHMQKKRQKIKDIIDQRSEGVADHTPTE